MITGKVSRKEKSGNAMVDTLTTAAIAIKTLQAIHPAKERTCTPGKR